MRSFIGDLVHVKEVMPTVWGFIVTPTYSSWAVYAPTCCKPYIIREKHALSDFIFVQH